MILISAFTSLPVACESASAREAASDTQVATSETEDQGGSDEGSAESQGGEGASPESGDASAETGAATAIRIVPLGDSLTFGTAADFSTALEGGYRIELSELLGGAGYKVDFEGMLSNGPADFDGDHQSEPGASIAVIAENWASAVDSVEPDIVLLMAGTNDQLGVTADQDPEPAAQALGQLIDQVLTDEPDATVVVATLPPLGTGFLVGEDKPARVQAYNALVPALVEVRQAAGAAVVLADLSSLDVALLGDGIHPSTMDGYDAMAQLWYPAVIEAIEAH